ncbi:MATE family efflux transporter [Flavonifractor sp. An52]|uniref:MATE family efflux transporter n=1 Tax=Flavonifractor sp. An52 TaxID=1965642 RepID=UPI000B39D155|nr:MATE family efflux transporter [Flavonifractor sp. An52]OUN84006.1 MATE family efflux transporter [Flavonifractor sp. An52]
MKRTNDLGHDPVFRLVCKLAIPTMLAQLVSVLYSIVDRIYIGNIPQIGDLALAGVGVCGPIVTLLSSFASLVGLGGSPILAMRMGEGNRKEASRVLSNSFFMLLVLSVGLTGLFLAMKGLLLQWFGASQATFGYADTYLTIYTAGTFFALMATGMNSFLIAQGFSGLGMATVMLGAVLNIVLDPIFIFVLKLDVAGAALATVISQMASCAFVLCSLLRKKMPVPLRWGGFDRKIMMRIVTFGLSPFLIIATDSVLLIVLNTVLQHYGGPELGDKLVVCATIVQSYLLLITMPMGGLTLGTQPVISFNYGAGNAARIKRAMKSIVGLCLTFCALMTVVTYTLSPVFVRLFTQNPELIDRSVGYIKVFTAMILPLAIQYPLVDETTALGHVRLALFCSLFRKTVFLACLLLLPALVSAEATFLSEPIADAVAATVTTILFLHFFPRILAERSGSPAAQ